MWMDLESIMLTKISQTEKYKLYDITHMWNLTKNTNESIYKTEIELQM